jgi:hypothetical protein
MTESVRNGRFFRALSVTVFCLSTAVVLTTWIGYPPWAPFPTGAETAVFVALAAQVAFLWLIFVAKAPQEKPSRTERAP